MHIFEGNFVFFCQFYLAAKSKDKPLYSSFRICKRKMTEMASHVFPSVMHTRNQSTSQKYFCGTPLYYGELLLCIHTRFRKSDIAFDSGNRADYFLE